MEDDNKAINTIRVLGLQKKSDDPRRGYWLYGNDGETINLALVHAGQFFWHVGDGLDYVQAQIEYQDEEKNEAYIKSVTFWGPHEKIRTLVEGIGFGAV